MSKTSTSTATVIRKVPLDPAVEKIMRQTGDLNPGDIVPYETIESCSLESRDTHRFKAVVAKWKRAIFGLQNVVVRNVPTVGYEVLSTDGRVMETGRLYKASVRRLDKAKTIIERTSTDDMSEQQIAWRSHLIHTHASIALYKGVKPQPAKLPGK